MHYLRVAGKYAQRRANLQGYICVDTPDNNHHGYICAVLTSELIRSPMLHGVHVNLYGA